MNRTVLPVTTRVMCDVPIAMAGTLNVDTAAQTNIS